MAKLGVALLCAAISACGGAADREVDDVLEVAERPPAPAPPPPRPTGFSLDSMPSGARVFLDGVEVGNTPLRAKTVTPGDHQIRVQLPEHAPWESSLHVTPGAVLELPRAVLVLPSAPPRYPPSRFPVTLPQAMAALDRDIQACIEYPAGAEVAYVATRKGGAARAVRIGTPAHARTEIACVHEALKHADLPATHSDERISRYFPSRNTKRRGFTEMGVIRLRAARALDDILIDVEPDEILDYGESLLLLRAQPRTLELRHTKTGKTMRIRVEPRLGREREYFVDLRKLGP